MGALLASEVSLLPVLFFLAAQLTRLAGRGCKLLGFGDRNLRLAPIFLGPPRGYRRGPSIAGKLLHNGPSAARVPWTEGAVHPAGCGTESHRHTQHPCPETPGTSYTALDNSPDFSGPQFPLWISDRVAREAQPSVHRTKRLEGGRLPALIPLRTQALSPTPWTSLAPAHTVRSRPLRTMTHTRPMSIPCECHRALSSAGQRAAHRAPSARLMPPAAGPPSPRGAQAHGLATLSPVRAAQATLGRRASPASCHGPRSRWPHVGG